MHSLTLFGGGTAECSGDTGAGVGCGRVGICSAAVVGMGLFLVPEGEEWGLHSSLTSMLPLEVDN